MFMDPKWHLSRRLSREVSQLGLALKDCARQFRYTARSVQGPVGRDKPVRLQGARTANTASPELSLGSVAHFADDLFETAETLAGYVVPPLQDHWKSPVTLEPLDRLFVDPDTRAKVCAQFSSTFYAAAKRLIMRSGALDVLIFEHVISDAFAAMNTSIAAQKTRHLGEAGRDEPDAVSRHALCEACAQFTLALIEARPIRSVRFDTPPDVSAPWWLVTEPNAYVFATLSLASLGKNLWPNELARDPDTSLAFFADVVGAREAAIRAALTQPDRLQALHAEIRFIVRHLF
jgi:hypothetical protein